MTFQPFFFVQLKQDGKLLPSQKTKLEAYGGEEIKQLAQLAQLNARVTLETRNTLCNSL